MTRRPSEHLPGRSNFAPQKTKKEQKSGRSPAPIDAFLMMYQTEWVETNAAGCEIEARLPLQNRQFQTVHRGRKGEEKSRSLHGCAIFRLSPLAGEQRLELWTRGFGATVGETLGNIYRPIFRTVAAFSFVTRTQKTILMLF